MPNHNLTEDARRLAIRKCGELMDLVVSHNQLDFPITDPSIIQRAIMPEHQIKALAGLQADGVRGLPRDDDQHFLFARDYIHGLERDAVVYIHLPRDIFFGKKPYVYPEFGRWSDDYMAALRLDVGVLPEETKAALATWTNTVVRAMRIKQLAESTVTSVIQRCITTAHVMAWWPTLAGLIGSAQTRVARRGVNVENWRDRFANTPRNLEKWAPKPDVRTALARRIIAADTAISAAYMLRPVEADKSKVYAIVKTWRRKDSDPVF